MTDSAIYVRFKGKVTGPLSANRVRQMIDRGQISRMHQLSTDRLTWTSADRFGDFYAVKGTGGEAAAEADEPLAALAGVEASLTGDHTGAADSDDSAQWYVRIDGENRGPVNANLIGAWAAEGNVTASTLVWRRGYEQWCSAEQVFPDWFEKATQPSMPSGDPLEVPRRQGESTGKSRRLIAVAVVILAVAIAGLSAAWLWG